MSRPKNERIVHNPPLFNEFKPAGYGAKMLKRQVLSLDEFEAIRLADSVGLSHIEAAGEMEMSRSTFTRLIELARKKVSDFLIQGNLLIIDGGNIHFRNNIIKCLDCGHMFKINFETTLTECPECHSANLLNLAGGFGHGNCCRNRNRNSINNLKRR